MTRVPLEALPWVVSFCDPAGKPKPGQKIKSAKARTAIVTIAGDGVRVFVLDAWMKKARTSEVIDQIFLTNERWHPRRFGIEANAMQELFGDAVLLEARRRHVRLPLVPVYPPTNIDKIWRIRTAVQPLTTKGRLFVPKHLIELRAEILAFPTGRTVDGFDALAQACELIPKRTEESTHGAASEERERLAAYLRRAGVPPSTISARMAQFDAERVATAARYPIRSAEPAGG